MSGKGVEGVTFCTPNTNTNSVAHIDTITLEIKLNGVYANHAYPFNHYNGWKKRLKGGFSWWELDTPRLGKIEGRYLPHVVCYEKAVRNGMAYAWFLEIRVSIPKLVNNNDYVPVTDKTAEQTAKYIIDCLPILGLPTVTVQQVISATIKRIDAYCDFFVPSMAEELEIIKRIKTARLPKSYDFGQITYLNNGFGLRIHGNKHRDIIFYDKRKELENSYVGKSKAAFEEDNYCQFNLLHDLRNSDSAILRYEIKVGSAEQVRRELRRLGICQDKVDFNWFCKNKIAGKLLDFYWGIIRSGLSDIGLLVATDLEIYEATARQGGNRLQKDAKYGRALLSRWENSQQLREIYEHYNGRNGWTALGNDIKKLPIIREEVHDPADLITNGLAEALDAYMILAKCTTKHKTNPIMAKPQSPPTVSGCEAMQ